MRRIFDLVILFAWITIAVIIINQPKSPEIISFKNPDKSYQVKKVIILSGNSFDLIIQDGVESRILAKLPVNCVKDAKGKVLDLLSNSTFPRVVLHEKQSDGQWLIYFYFTNDNKEINLADWLVKNKLVYK